MQQDVTDIHDLDLIGASEAAALLEIKNKGHVQILTLRYRVPQIKTKSGTVFLKKDIEILKESDHFKANKERRAGKNPRKIPDTPIQFSQDIDIETLKIIGSTEAMKALEVKYNNQFHVMIERYEIPHKKLKLGYIFLRSDIEKVKKSARRIENLRRRHGK